MVAAETARSMPPDGRPAAARGQAASATAVEGYVPRAAHSRQKAAGRQGQRRVRWSDEVEDEEAGAAEAEPLASDAQQQCQLEAQHPAGELQPGKEQGQGAAAAPPLQAAPAHDVDTPQVASGGGAPASNPVLVFEVEEPASTLEVGQAGLEAQFGRLRVAEATSLPAAAAAAVASAAASTASSLANGAAGGSSSSSSIDIQRSSAGGSGNGWSVPPEWREAPQFYAHSPVGSSSSLASWASPGGSSGSNALAAAASSPPSKGGGSAPRPPAAPPGLPRPPSISSSRQQQLRQLQSVGQEARPAAHEQRLQEQQERQQEQQAGLEQPFLTKRQAEQLQRAFPSLAGTLPPELQAVLESDSETGSEAADSEDWMRSDDEEAELGIRWGL